jgi:dTDP-4-amino-4,6-dideoxygalactose transaminase
LSVTDHPGLPSIRFQRPSLPSASRIDRYLELSREDHWFSNGGPCWRLLRDRLADRVGAYCVPVASGTLGLMATMVAVLSGRRDPAGSMEALLPSFTFLATAQAALWSGLQPRLIDIDSSHWHLDPSRLERALVDRRSNVGIVVAVSSFGTPPPSETRLRWESACRSAGIPLIVDSAAAFGAMADDGTSVGAQGDAEIVSFHATKPFAVGEGGAVFTRDRALCERVELAVNFGLRSDRSVGLEMGLNAKMSELHAATALAVLDEFDSILDSRRRAAASIRAQAGPNITWQAGCEHSTWQFVPVAFAGPDERMQAGRSSRGCVEVRTYYEPLHEMDPYRHWPIVDGGLSQTAELHKRILCLPMANDLTDLELEVIGSLLHSDKVADEMGARARSGLPA